jgi:small subunit ribosomal protein S20
VADKKVSIHKSVLKRERQTRRRHERNRGAVSAIRTAVKKVETALASKNIDQAKTLFVQASAVLDRAADKKIIPANRASRKISRLARRINKSASPPAPSA